MHSFVWVIMTAVITSNTVLGYPNVELQDFLQKKQQISGYPLLIKLSSSSGKTQPIS